MSDNPQALRDQIARMVHYQQDSRSVSFEVHEALTRDGYTRQRITYKAADGDTIPAYLLLPDGNGPFPAILAHHQHAGQRHFGKSEVIGLVGDPLQAFGPALAQRGVVVLAPDSICFEDRRRNRSGTEPAEDEDGLQHYRELGERLTLGQSLMGKVLSDASSAIAILMQQPQVDAARVGLLGHSYGGNTVLFQMAVDARIAFAVSSGALCSYAHKRANDIALEMALIIPSFAALFDLHHLLDCIAPRPLLVVSAEDDPFSQDAPAVVARAKSIEQIEHLHDAGGHAMTPERFERIIAFLATVAAN